MDVPHKGFEKILAGARRRPAAADRRRAVRRRSDERGRPDEAADRRLRRRALPAGPAGAALGRVAAVFASWGNRARPRATAGSTSIADDLGTAVNVQAMVFGNRGADCATGVAFTRNPATGEKVLRRVPGQRPGRGRGGRHPHAAAGQPRRRRPRRHGARLRRRLRPAAGGRPRPRGSLQGHAGHRVHHPARRPLHAPDPHRQAHRAGGGAHRRRHGGGGADRRAARRCGGSSRPTSSRCWRRIRPRRGGQGQGGREVARQGAAGRPRRGLRRHRAGPPSAPPRWRTTARCCWCAPRPRPRTSSACTPRPASSPRAAA